MRRSLTVSLAAIATIALAACGSGGPKTEEQVKQEVAKIERPQPGLYKQVMKVTKYEIPGMSADHIDFLKQQMGSTGKEITYCITKEDSENGFKEMTKKLERGKCTYDRFEANSGRLDVKMTCEIGQGMRTITEVAGTTTSEGSEMKIKAQQTGGQNINMEMEVSNQRIGDCPA